MNLRTGFLITALILATVALTCPGVDAGTVGKIHGVVLDSGGNPLPGASVVIEGTRRGTTTDPDGFYVILSVEPGTYSLAATMVGYRKVTKSKVKVQIDYTTKVDFQLSEVTIQADEMVVVAERPPVEPDKTHAKYIVTSEDIELLPIVRSTDELISLQPGVSQDGLFRIRGGDVGLDQRGYQTYYRPTDVAFVVDGIRVVSNDGHLNRMFSGINTSAIQEISLITGVTPAEYGNAQAGVINIVTKEGGESYHGWTEYRNIPAGKKHWGANVYDSPGHRDRMKWGDNEWETERDSETGRIIHQRTDYTGVTGHELEGVFSGPLARDLSFVLSGKHIRRASEMPGPEEVGFREGGQFVYAPKNIHSSGAVTWRMTPNVKVKAGVVWQSYTAWEGTRSGTTAGGARGMEDSGRNLFLPENYSSSGRYKFREDLEYVVLTHTVSHRTFYEVRFSRSRSFRDTIGAPVETTVLRKDGDNWFNLGLESANWERFDRQRYALKADLSSQISKGHFLKTGAELTLYKSWWFARLDTQPGDPWVQYFGGDREIGEPVNPIQGAFYAQDKMEFEGLVINLGLRMDYFNARTRWPASTALFGTAYARYFTTQHLVPTQDVDAHLFFSPRLGISHPVTERLAMHFSTGVFRQFPGFFALYGQAYQSNRQPPSLDLNGNGRIDLAEHWNNMVADDVVWGWPANRPERSLSFEVGVDWNFVSDYTASLTTFYRAESEQMGNPITSFSDPWQSQRTRVWRNLRTEDVRGFEVSVRKSLSHNFGFQLAYNMQWSEITQLVGRGNISHSIRPDSMYIATGNWTYQWDIDQATGARIPRPLTEAEIQEYGRRANDGVRNDIQRVEAREESGGRLGGFYDYASRAPGEEGEKGLYIFGGSQMRGIHTWGEKPADRRNSLKLQMLFLTPGNTSFGPVWMEALVRDININVLYRVQSGSTFTYSPPGGEATQWRPGPLESRFDIEATKTINSRGWMQASLFLTIDNLFNEKNIREIDSFSQWVEWGLEMPRPNNPDLIAYGDLNDTQRYTGSPRQVELGLRLRF